MKKILVLFLAIAATANLYSAQKYEIKVSRPIQKDFSYTISGTRDIEDLTRVTDTEKNEVLNEANIKTQCIFKGKVTVTEVDEKGVELAKKMEISECKIKKDGETSELFPAGTVLLASWSSGSLEITDDKGESIGEEAHETVKDFFTRNGSDFENIKISDQPRSAGEIWEIKGATESFLESIGNSMIIDKNDVKITAKLSEIKKISGIESMKVDIEVAIAKFQMPDSEGSNIKKSKINVKYSILLPIDANIQPLGQELEMTIDIDMLRDANADEGTPAMQLIKKAFQSVKLSNSFEPVKQPKEKADPKKKK